MAWSLALAALLAAPAASPGAVYRGEFSNAFTGQVGNLRFIGGPRNGGTALRGRVRCRRCPVRGPLRAACAGDATSSFCSGTIGGGRCTVEGYLYGSNFEGTYACGGTVGSFSYRGRR
jgi:hypothetical protein